jgi:peptidoglycan/LPS O-acetylase OafA/YrhL
MWNDSDKFSLVPPAWSLGAEIQFYLLFPLLLLARLRAVAFVLSVAVFLAAFFGLIHTEWFGYRLLPGVLFVFLLGSALHDAHRGGNSGPGRGWTSARAIVLVTVLGVVALAVAGSVGGALRLPYNPETLIGLAVAIPLLHLLAPRPSHPWDERAGELSYGLFLLHFFVFWIWPGADGGPLALTSRIAVALALAWLLHRFVEAPVLAWRRRLRQGTSRPSGTLP